MRRFLLAATVALSVCSPAYSATTTPWTATDSVTGLNDVSVSNAGSFTDPVPLNHTLASAFNLFTLTPGGSCTGVDCVGGPGGTVTELLTVAFTGLSIQGYTLAPFTLTGTYTAKYAGSELTCASGDGVSPSSGQTDCFAWTGATATNWSGTKLVNEAIGNTGTILALTFHNATDWSITPSVTAQLLAAPAPEPAPLAILGVGMLSLGMLRINRRRS